MKKIKTIEKKIENLNDLDELPKSGIDIIRINSSYIRSPYNDIANIEDIIKYIKKNYPKIKIQLELQGKKIKISNILKEDLKIRENDVFCLCSETYYVNNRTKNFKDILIPITHYELLKRSLVKYIYLKDYSEKLDVLEFKDNLEILEIRANENITISKGKSIHTPGLKRYDSDLTAKDKEDLKWGLNIGIDIFSLSYCSSKNDILEVSKYLYKLKKDCNLNVKYKLWGKIEESQGIDNIKDIIDACDGIVITDGYDYYENKNLSSLAEDSNLCKSLKRAKKDIVISVNALNEEIAKNIMDCEEKTNKNYNFLLIEQKKDYKLSVIKKICNFIKITNLRI